MNAHIIKFDIVYLHYGTLHISSVNPLFANNIISTKKCEILFSLNYCAKKRIFCLNDFKYGIINFQEKQPAKYENLGIVSFKTISIMSQGKAICRQKIPQSNCLTEETADRDIIKTFKNGNSKIMQPIRITSGSPTQIRK